MEAGPATTMIESGDKKYRVERLVGTGSFGSVYLAIDLETAEQVAIKQVLQDKRFKNRELEILQKVSHCNIVSLLHAFTIEAHLYMAMEYVPETLARVLRQYKKSREPMPEWLVQTYLFQMLKALAYLHTLGIATRDCKPQNVLINTKSHEVKLCDMGSSKVLRAGEGNVAYICSRFYRAPELIFAATEYTVAIDVWSAGAVFGEMLNGGTALFAGTTSVDQLVEIIKVLGTPTNVQILAMNPDYKEFKFPQVKAQPLGKVLGKRGTHCAVNLLSAMLQYDPTIRIQAKEALAHAFFDQLRTAETAPLPSSLFYFSPAEQAALGAALLAKIAGARLTGAAATPQ